MPFATPQAAGSIYESAIQAAATNYGAFTVRDDFMPEIGDYLYEGNPLWTLLRKEEAEADLVREMLYTARPKGGFVNKNGLTEAAVEDNKNFNSVDLTDPGQTVKAYANSIEWSHYARSLHAQQGRPYQDAVTKDTNGMIVDAKMDLEQTLISGDATDNPLAFNGIVNQMPDDAEHKLAATILGADPDSIGQKLAESITRITVQRRKRRRVQMIMCSGAGFNALQKEVEEKRLYIQTVEVIPGLQVPGIMTPTGVVPLVMSPHFDDTPPVTGTNPEPGKLHYWLLDMDKLCWKGVIPFGGVAGNYDHQLFEVTQFTQGEYLIERRLLLQYGTLYAMDRGDGIFRLSVDAPDNMIWAQGPRP